MKSQWVLINWFFTKIHLKKSHFTFAPRISFFERVAQKLSLVCGGFNIFFSPQLLRRCINRKVRDQFRAQALFAALK
jgi:hypothetical protein